MILLNAKMKFSNGLMKIGKMSYNTIVLPTHKWMSQKALEKLEAFQDKGGCILDASSLSHAPKTCVVTGKGNRTAGAFRAKRIAGRIKVCFDLKG